MELRHLRYFVAVVGAGSLTEAAAEKLHTSQPSNSASPAWPQAGGRGTSATRTAASPGPPPPGKIRRRGNTREAAIRPNRIRSSEQKTPSLASVARLKCLWFSSDVGFSRLSNFPEEVEPAISGRINPSKPAWRQFYQGTARAGIKNGNYSESKALLLGLIAASLVLPL